MSDVINSIFGRAQNETPSSEGYGYGTTAAAVDTDTDSAEIETVEPAEDTAETEDAVDETADVDDAEDTADADADSVEAEEDATDEESDEAVAAEESEEDTETAEEAVADETEAAEEAPVPVVAETEADSRPAAGTRGSTTVADGVVSKIVIRVARKAEGVYELDEAGTSVEVEGEVATIAVTLVVEFGRAVKALAEQIRVQLVEAVEDYLGLEVASVDVHVADIHFPDAD